MEGADFEAWLAAPARADLDARAPEVVLTTIAPTDAFARSVRVQPPAAADDGGGGRHALVAARSFVAGEIILAELAVAWAEPDLWLADATAGGAPALVSPASGVAPPSLAALARSLRFSAPFDAVRGAAIRVAAQVEPRGRPPAPPPAPDAPARATTRADVLAAALRHAALRCPRARDDAYAPRQGGPAAARGVAAPPAGDVDALFARASLLAHGCDANAAYRSGWDVRAGAPAVQVFATRAIAPGEGVTLALVDPVQSRPERQLALLARFGARCACARCTEGCDDAVSVRCGACSAGAWRGGGGGAPCAACGAGAPPDDALHATRERALLAYGGPADLPALGRVLNDDDAGMIARLLAAVPALLRAAGPEAPPHDARATAARALAAARALPRFPLSRLLDATVEHALLCGATGDGAASAAAWADAAVLARACPAVAPPLLVEAFDAFARKPPRDRAEAAMADRMRRQLAWQQ